MQLQFRIKVDSAWKINSCIAQSWKMYCLSRRPSSVIMTSIEFRIVVLLRSWSDSHAETQTHRHINQWRRPTSHERATHGEIRGSLFRPRWLSSIIFRKTGWAHIFILFPFLNFLQEARVWSICELAPPVIDKMIRVDTRCRCSAWKPIPAAKSLIAEIVY